MIKLSKNQIVHYCIFFVLVVILSFSSYNHQIVEQKNQINNVSNLNYINDRKTTPYNLFFENWSVIKNNYYLSDLNKQDWSRWKKRYKHQIKTEEDAYIAINTMLASLDDSYSKFLSSDEFGNQNRSINSKLYGIGINIASISGKIFIINVIQNAPAYNQGIRAGDIILKVDNKDISGESIYQVAQLIRGDLDENIDLELMRGQEKFSKSIKREEIKVKTVEYKKITDDIGYIRVSSFIGADTTREFIIALSKLNETKALILDLRGNSGGLFQNAIIMSNFFLKKGIIVNVIARHGKKNTYSAQSDVCIYENPLVILIDEDSASASEILSSALSENHRATLIGTKTFGKGLVQKVYSMPNKSGLNLTIARYLTPSGKDINKKGIEPDYKVTLAHSDLINNTDSQLDFAKEYLEKKIKK